MRIGKVFAISMLILFVFAGSVMAEDRVSLGFLYGSTENLDLIDRTNGAINQVAPTCLDLDEKGNLDLTSNLTHTFVEKMHERGLIVTPFLSNHWARQKGRRAINNAEKLSDQIVKVINDYDLDGINVDIENLTEDDRDDLTNFVQVLRNKMPEGKLLTVCVAANPTGREDGWQGSYDYEKLGEISDYIFIMTYDEHSVGSPEGPVASNEFVENSIIYALQYVSKDKIVMGIPFYGRYWANDNEDYLAGQAVVIGAVPTLISKHKGIVEYYKDVGETKATITVNNELVECKINGEQLPDGTYTIWYQTNDDIKSKLAIVNKYDLLGCGVWALGQEKAEVWKYFYDELNKTPRVAETEEQEVEETEVKDFEYYAAIVRSAGIESEFEKNMKKTICKKAIEKNNLEREDKLMINNISLRIKNSNEVRFNEKENRKEDRKSSYDAGIVTDFKKVRRTKLEKHY